MKVCIIKNYRKYDLPHVMCGFVDESDFKCFTWGHVSFGDGTSIRVDSDDHTDDLIITDIPASEIPE